MLKSYVFEQTYVSFNQYLLYSARYRLHEVFGMLIAMRVANIRVEYPSRVLVELRGVTFRCSFFLLTVLIFNSVLFYFNLLLQLNYVS